MSKLPALASSGESGACGDHVPAHPEDLARPIAAQAAALALLDAVAFLRSTYTVSVAATAQTMAFALRGETPDAGLHAVATALDTATRQVERIAQFVQSLSPEASQER